MKLVIKNLYKSYDFPVLENINIVIDKNLTRISGDNGSGKSTLLKILSGKINYESGEIFLDNNKVTTSYLAQNSVLVNQDINLFLNETVEYNIKFIAKRINYNLIEEFGFKEDLKKKVNELSGGYKKKLMIMISFMLNPNILLLDEYSSYLDKESLDIINKKIIEYSKDHLVIYVDHNDTLNGIVKDISTNDSIEEFNYKVVKDKFRFKFRFSILDIITSLFLIIFLVLSQVSFSFNETTPKEIGANYVSNNNMWFEFIDNNQFSLDYEKYYIYSNNSNNSFDFVIYTLDDFPLQKQSNIKNEYECYVFSNNASKYENYIEVDDNNYFVKGIIDLNVDCYSNFELTNLFNSVVIIGNYEGDNFLDRVAINCKNNIKELYLNEDIINIFNPFYTDFSYQYIYKIMIVATIIYIGISVAFVSLNKAKESHVLSSYNNSKKNLFMNYTLSYFIIGFLIIVISTIISWESLIVLYNKVIPIYNVNYLKPFKIIIIEYIIFFISYCFSLYFVQARLRKNINDYD